LLKDRDETWPDGSEEPGSAGGPGGWEAPGAARTVGTRPSGGAPWLASDGRWYPAELAPGPPPPTAGPPWQTFPGSAPWADPPRLAPSGSGRGHRVALVFLVVLAGLIGIGVVVRIVRAGFGGHGPTASAGNPTPAQTVPTLPAPTSLYRPPMAADGDPQLLPFAPPLVVPTRPSAASVPAVLYAVTAGPTLVTPAAASAVVSALWPLRAQAIAGQDAVTLGHIEDASALAVDGNRGHCGCNLTDHFGPILSQSVLVPKATQYPAEFYAEVATTLNSTAWFAQLVFTRQSVNDPWRLSFSGGYEPANTAQAISKAPKPGADGYAPAVDPQLQTIAARQPAALAAYWQYWRDHGVAPVTGLTTWTPGFLTDGWGRTIVAAGRPGQVNTGNGLIGYYRYDTGSDQPTYVFSLLPNEQLVCSTIRQQNTWTGTPGKPDVFQPLARTNWGEEVAPGVYRAMHQNDLWSPCIYVYEVAGTLTNAVTGTEPFTLGDVAIP
jgi:hypothetical protein